MENIILNNDMNNDENYNIDPFINRDTQLIKLLDDINSELFYNYTQCDYMAISWGIYYLYFAWIRIFLGPISFLNSLR